MAKVIKKSLILSDEEAALLGEGMEFDIIPNDKGIFLVIDKTLVGKKEGKQVCVQVPALEDEKQHVIGLIRKGKLSELVEGKFEATLNEKQKKALLELVTTQSIYVFKLNESYKKGVYRVKEDEQKESNREKKESEDFNAPEKEYKDYTLEKDGFLIIRGKDVAANASYSYHKQIKEGLLRGIKSFDGNYYLIENDLLGAYINKIISALMQKNSQTLEELARAVNISKRLTKIICEFLKEEGELMEKKKENYAYIR